MLRKPQGIEMLVLTISFGCLGWLLLSLNPEQAAPNRPFVAWEVQTGFILTALCIAGQTFFRRTAFRVAALGLQGVVLLATLSQLGGICLIEECFLVSLAILQCSLRLTVSRGTVVGIVILGLVTVTGLTTGGGIEGRIYVLLYGLSWVTVSEFFMHYREKLVEKSKALDLQNRSVENLVAANRSFVEYLENAKSESADKERMRITRELHDSIGYSMTSMAMMMNASRHLIKEDPDKLLEFCSKSRDLAATTLRETREILYKLRATEQYKTDNPAIFFINLCRDFGDATGVGTECHVGNLPSRINERVFNALFRAVQVGFINALRHGGASRIRLMFWVSDEELSMRIWNNTQLSTEETAIITKGIGLNGISERLESLNGRLQMGTVEDGFELVVTIPREETAHGLN